MGQRSLGMTTPKSPAHQPPVKRMDAPDPRRPSWVGHRLDALDGIYRTLLPLVSLEFLVRRASKLWQRYHDTGHMTCERAGENELQIILRDYPDIPKHHAPEIEGAFEALLHVAKVKEVRIAHTECANRGGTCCRWSLGWTR